MKNNSLFFITNQQSGTASPNLSRNIYRDPIGPSKNANEKGFKSRTPGAVTPNGVLTPNSNYSNSSINNSAQANIASLDGYGQSGPYINKMAMGGLSKSGTSTPPDVSSLSQNHRNSAYRVQSSTEPNNSRISGTFWGGAACSAVREPSPSLSFLDDNHFWTALGRPHYQACYHSPFINTPPRIIYNNNSQQLSPLAQGNHSNIRQTHSCGLSNENRSSSSNNLSYAKASKKPDGRQMNITKHGSIEKK